MKIVIPDPLPAAAVSLLEAEGWTVDTRTGRSPAELRTELIDADALIVRSATTVTAELIAGAPRLRVVARAGTGVDNVDIAAASDRGIVVLNAPGANSVSVAEHVFRSDARLGPVRRPRRRAVEGRALVQEEPAGSRTAEQDARRGRASDASGARLYGGRSLSTW